MSMHLLPAMSAVRAPSSWQTVLFYLAEATCGRQPQPAAAVSSSQGLCGPEARFMAFKGL